MISSPLRYPGGKAKLFAFFSHVVRENGLFSAHYGEPYAGGAGLALKLLANGFVSRITINDIDPSIYAFWQSVVNRSEEFCKLVEGVQVSIEEWYRQKDIWLQQDLENPLALGFSTFFLNRTNRSGIIQGAGPIGGYAQQGDWTLDVRFTKKALINNILAIGRMKPLITVSCLDAVEYLPQAFSDERSFVYLDPPYYVKGGKLYTNFYNHDDHVRISEVLWAYRDSRWVLSYDDAPEIRDIYDSMRPITYDLDYSAAKKQTGKEIMYASRCIRIPEFPGFCLAA